MRLLCLGSILAVAFISGCGGGTVIQQADQPIKLEFKPTGEDYVNYVADFGINSNIEGSVTVWLSTIDFGTKVDLINEEGIERRFRFDEFTVTTISGERPEPDPDAPEYAGTTLWLKLGPDGSLIDWKGLDGVGGRTVDGRSFKQYIVYQLLGMLQPPPEEPVNAGSRWEREYTMELRAGGINVEFVTTVHYTVEGFGVRAGRECAKIDMSLVIEATGEGTIGGKEASFASSASGSGNLWFDHVNGVVVEYTHKTTTTRQQERERAGKEDITTTSTTLDSEVEIKLAM